MTLTSKLTVLENLKQQLSFFFFQIKLKTLLVLTIFHFESVSKQQHNIILQNEPKKPGLIFFIIEASIFMQCEA